MALQFVDATYQAASGKHLFFPKNGNMGLCGGLVRPNDSVVLLAGGETPYIVRRLRRGISIAKASATCMRLWKGAVAG